MAGLVKRERKGVEPVGTFDRFDGVFDEWPRMMMPMRLRSLLFPELGAGDFIRVDEFREDGAVVIRAELPGIDPDKDVELTVTEGMLHIKAERREEEHKEGTGYVRQELHYGSFTRTLPLPQGVTETDINASYKGGILEVRVPSPTLAGATKIPIAKD